MHTCTKSYILEGDNKMTTEEFKIILDKGETDTVEFKSWIKAKNQKEIIALAVDELIALTTFSLLS